MENRYDFVYLFDVKDGNPNGDPDAGNLPRVDPETGQGLVTDVCLKRKIRNYVGLKHEEKPPHEIYVKDKSVLNKTHMRAYQELKIKHDPKKPPRDEEARNLTQWMCKNFYDIRTFGAVMMTEVNCGQVRGAVQFGIARSIDPIVTLEHAVTRCAVTNEKDVAKERTMGRKFAVPYGLYRVHGFVNAPLAVQTLFSTADLDLLWESLERMFETDRSASRGEMTARKLVVFKHDSPLGSVAAHRLQERVKVTPVATNGDARPPRAFTDYDVTVDTSGLPSSVTVDEKF